MKPIFGRAITRKIIGYGGNLREFPGRGQKKLKRRVGPPKPVQSKATPYPTAGTLGHKLDGGRRNSNDRGPFHGDGVNIATQRENIGMRAYLRIDQFKFVQRGPTIAESQPTLSGVQVMSTWRFQWFHSSIWPFPSVSAKPWTRPHRRARLH